MPTTQQQYHVSLFPHKLGNLITAGGPTEAAQKWVSSHPVYSLQTSVIVSVEGESGQYYKVVVTCRMTRTWSARRINEGKERTSRAQGSR